MYLCVVLLQQTRINVSTAKLAGSLTTKDLKSESVSVITDRTLRSSFGRLFCGVAHGDKSEYKSGFFANQK